MKKIIYGIIIAFIIITTGVLIVKLNIKKETPEIEECHSITGGGYNITFNTNSEISVNDIHVCIACPPDSYDKLPIIEKDGYIFDGWYYDLELTKKVEVTTTLDITPQPIYQKENCITGYKNITLHAKWNIIDKN